LAASIKWLGHACFWVVADGKSICIDLGENNEPVGGADLILVTHAHADHFDPVKVANARKEGTAIIAPADCACKVGGGARAMEPGEEAAVGGLKVRAVHAYNIRRFRSPGIPFHPKGQGVGYLITAGGKTIYHAGDTDFIPEMRGLGPVDVAILPTGGTFTMDNDEAAKAAMAIKPRIAIPMHRLDSDPVEFKRNIDGGAGIQVIIMREGEEFAL